VLLSKKAATVQPFTHTNSPDSALLLLVLLPIVQAVGQALWCFAHTLWVGNSFMVTTSLGLMAHHLFGCWHGDRRLEAKYGEAFEKVRLAAGYSATTH
jgi:uncharacterized membrane protein